MMKKTLTSIAVGASLSLTTMSALADLSATANLEFVDGATDVIGCLAGTFNTATKTCQYGTAVQITDMAGSYFGMDTITPDGIFEPAEKVALENAGSGGVTLGVAQAAGSIDNAWVFGPGLGNHYTTSGIASTADDSAGNVTLGMSPWTVYWNGGVIDMGAGADAVVTCGVDCADGDTFVLEYQATVPSGSFTGVKYALHLEGTIVVLVSDTAPVALGDSYTVDRNSTGNVFDVLTNDVDNENNIDITSVQIVVPASRGTTTINADGTITYDAPSGNSLSSASFTYTVEDTNNNVSNEVTVDITIQNALPVAVNDAESMNPAGASSVDIDVTANDTDVDGTIDTSTVAPGIKTPDHGNIEIDPVSGVITYTPVSGFIGIDTFTYTVADNDAGISNEATVVVSISTVGVLDPSAFLLMETGNVSDQFVKPAVGEGSWFSMEIKVGEPQHTPLAGFNHIQLGSTQDASSDPLLPNIDQAWLFVGALGVHRTTTPITAVTDDSAGNVSLGFYGWNVSWNGIPSIPLGAGQDNGIATMTCYFDLALSTQGDCSPGDEFVLDYSAIVPEGDASGFGGVNYKLHLEGVISLEGAQVGGGNIEAPYDVVVSSATDANGATVPVVPGDKADSVGNLTGFGLTVAEIGVADPLMNPENGVQCIGGCADFVIQDITTDYADLVFKLSTPLPESTVLRKLIDGRWQDFDTSGGAQVGSALSDQGGNCQGPDGLFQIGLREGNDCVFIRIFDGGKNDADGLKDGKITDPSGALLPGSPNTPAGSTSGCSISSTNVGVMERADWLLVAGFIAWFGLMLYRRKKAMI